LAIETWVWSIVVTANAKGIQMGGIGSGNQHGGNQYTRFREWREKYGPDEPYPLKQKDGSIVFVMELPKRAKRRPRYERSDKGTKRPKNNFERQQRASKLTFRQSQEDIARTYKEIQKYEEQERVREAAKLPENVERARQRNREAQRKYYDKRIARRRKSCLPVDRKCVLCEQEKATSKQWVVMEFADGKHAICRICYEQLRRKQFDCDSELLRSFVKTCKFDALKERCI
jgi:hypothetical protein